MMTLAWQTLRPRWYSVAGMFAAVTCAVALVTAVGVLMETGARGGHGPVERYAGAPLVVGATQSLTVQIAGGDEAGERVALPERALVDAGLAETIRAVDGVERVVVDREVAATLTTADRVALTGADGEPVRVQGWASAELTPFRVEEGRAPSAEDEVVLDARVAAAQGISIGDALTVVFARERRQLRVTGLAAAGEGYRGPAAVFLFDGLAERVAADPARADALGVLLRPGADVEEVAGALRAALDGRAEVYSGGRRAMVESPEVGWRNEELVSLAGAFGGFAGMLAVLVLAGMMGLAVAQRSRELALLRTIGATPRQIRRLLLGEATLIGLAASVVGVLPGVALGVLLFNALVARGIGSEETGVIVGPVSVLVAVGLGLVTSCLAAWSAGRRVTKVRPATALMEASMGSARTGWVRLLLGLVALGGGVALSVVAMTSIGTAAVEAALGALLILLVAVGLLGPVAGFVAIRLLSPLIGRISVASGFLAMAHARTQTRRLAAVAALIAVTVGFAVADIGAVTVPMGAAEAQTRERLRAEMVVSAPGGLPPGFEAEVRGLPGVAGATGVAPASVGLLLPEFDGEVFDFLPAAIVSGADVETTLELEVREGSPADLSEGAVAISTDLGRTLKAGVGDTVRLRLGDGTPVEARVGAVFASSLGFADVVLPRVMVRGHATTAMDTYLLVRLAPGADAGQVERALREAGGYLPGLQVEDASAWQVAQSAEAEAQAWVNYLVLSVLVLFCAISVVNTLAVVTASRAGDVMLLRLAGATHAQIGRMVRWEALVTAGLGLGLGFAVAAATLTPLSRGLAGESFPAVPWQVVAGAVALTVALAVGATEGPLRWMLRRETRTAV